MRGGYAKKTLKAIEVTAEYLSRASAVSLGDISRELELMSLLLRQATAEAHDTSKKDDPVLPRAGIDQSLDDILTSVAKVTLEDLGGCRKLDLLTNIGQMYESMGMFENALDCYLGALTASKRELTPHDKADIELKAGNMWCGMGQWKEADKCLTSALEAFNSSGGRIGAIKAHTLLGRVYYQQGRYHAAKRTISDGVALAKEVGDEKAIADLCNSLGLAYSLAAEHGNSLCSFQDALVAFQKTFDYRGVAEVYHNIARVHIRQNRLSDAASSCDKSLIMCEKISNHTLLPFVLLTKAEIAWEKEDYLACASFCRKGMELLAGWGGPLALAKVNRILGDLIASVINWKHAEPFYRHSGSLYKAHGVKAGEAWVHVASARALEDEGHCTQAMKRLEKALRIYQEIELDRDAENVAKKISSLRELSETPISK
jgi:tetratricopeptide (TPR) repeat protein